MRLGLYLTNGSCYDEVYSPLKQYDTVVYNAKQRKEAKSYETRRHEYNIKNLLILYLDCKTAELLKCCVWQNGKRSSLLHRQRRTGHVLV